MAIRTEVRRNAGHPWDDRPGFDLMAIYAESPAELAAAQEKAERKFWQTWICGTRESDGKAGAVMYKPCGAREPWLDSPEQPHPGNPPTILI